MVAIDKTKSAKKRKRQDLLDVTTLDAFIKRKRQEPDGISSRTFDALNEYCLVHIFSFLPWEDGFPMRQGKYSF